MEIEKDSERYVYKKVVDKSLLTEGISIPAAKQPVFVENVSRRLQRGEKRIITIYLNGKSYKAKLVNQSIASKFGNHADKVQIRYTKNGDLARALQGIFNKSYKFILKEQALRPKGSKKHIIVPDEDKEYLAIYTTEYEDSYIFETIESQDIQDFKMIAAGMSERTLENELERDVDPTATIIEKQGIKKIRKLNRRIGIYLKGLYGYRCQICGQITGAEYGAHIAEAHHIDYFVNSLNNDASNQLIVCPNHHSLIHDRNPKFNRQKLIYIYENGREQKIVLNKHLNV